MQRELARAKVNLDLHILGKRPDGYHHLLTYVAFPELADTLAFQKADALELQVGGEFAPLAGDAEDNLVLRAARALQAHTNTSHGARIELIKNIPVGAGLGGGSADAAATLRGLNRLWDLKLGMDALQRIGLTLGADVPMCLYSSPLRAEGVGEILTLLEPAAKPYWMVLVYPREKLETAKVFAAWKQDSHEPAPDGHVLPLTNDLQAAAIGLCPVIGEVLDALDACSTTHVRARMTGSGSCCFHTFHDEAQARACAANIAKHHPQWWVAVTAVT